MNRFATAILALFACASASADTSHPRPQILGIFSVHFYSTDLPAAREFYSRILDDPEIVCHWCEALPSDRLAIILPSKQILTFSLPTGVPPSNLLVEIVFATDNAKAMREYLMANKIAIEKQEVEPPGATVPSSLFMGFTVFDPEKHRIGFLQVPKTWKPSPPTNALRIIHAGFVVNDPAAENRFYKDLLGFHLYWHGGRQPNKDDWVALQVSDGTDWVEYMLNISPTANHHTLGVANHIALGVEDIHATQKLVIENGFQPAEEPQLGLDGKWQLNVYDPDGTRTEFMEFKPVEKPCCSEFTGVQPGPQ
ncbi:MAG: VOC family protein [Candidatus Acidiferrum sp.]|jgi:catechol 2,3-dioxygenase-like lactoylglutathione lyase family enzyme